MRIRYLSKLVYHKVWLGPLQRPKQVQHLAILDWDDTFLPTSFLLKHPGEETVNLATLVESNL
jgi:hypothetical protein